MLIQVREVPDHLDRATWWAVTVACWREFGRCERFHREAVQLLADALRAGAAPELLDQLRERVEITSDHLEAARFDVDRYRAASPVAPA